MMALTRLIIELALRAGDIAIEISRSEQRQGGRERIPEDDG